MRVNDTLSGFLLLLFAGAVLFATRTFPATAGQGLGPALFPRLIAIGLALCGAVLVWSGRRQPASARLAPEEKAKHPRKVLQGALVIGALIFYALAVERVGFFLTAFVFLAVLLFAFGAPRRWIPLLAAAVTLAMHFVFYTLLRVPLAWGWFEPLAW